jgi:putative transcriptional regulator
MKTVMTKFGKELIEALGEALDHARGKRTKTKTHRLAITPIDVKSIRSKLRLTQDQMSSLLGVSLSGYRKWEQGERRPQGAARTLLKVMEREPEAVLKSVLRQ